MLRKLLHTALLLLVAILAHADEKLFGKLGTYVTCEPVFEEKKLFHG